MLILLSPAKKLTKETTNYPGGNTTPQFVHKTNELINIMRSKSIDEIASLMHLSKNLAELNFNRYQELSVDNTDKLSLHPAVFLFQGDVYQGLDVATLSEDALHFAQSHLAILSGLYGLLKPSDAIMPYRLEMGTSLVNSCGSNLYVFWRDSITELLNKTLAHQESAYIINLASAEYYKAINEDKLNYPVINISFYERKGNALKVIGIYAKKARGAMARYILANYIDTPEEICSFDGLGYQYNAELSTDKNLVFISTRG